MKDEVQFQYFNFLVYGSGKCSASTTCNNSDDQSQNDEIGSRNNAQQLCDSSSKEMCISALAQRRSANLPKLKELPSKLPDIDLLPLDNSLTVCVYIGIIFFGYN